MKIIEAGIADDLMHKKQITQLSTFDFQTQSVRQSNLLGRILLTQLLAFTLLTNKSVDCMTPCGLVVLTGP